LNTCRPNGGLALFCDVMNYQNDTKKYGDPPLILPLCWRPLSADETTNPPETPAP